METHSANTQQPVDTNNVSIVSFVQPTVVSGAPEPAIPLNDPNIVSGVITEEPRGGDTIPEDEEETQESFAIVEQALSRAHFRDAGGFALEYGWSPCCPTLSINPTLGSYPISVRTQGWKINGSSNRGCYCCCFPSTRNWQTITLAMDGEEILNFIYRPRIWCFLGLKERIVDIYIPQRNKRIGWIKYGNTFTDGAIVADCVTNSVFVAKKIQTDTDVIALQVTSNLGIPVAIAQATRGWRYRGFVTWKEFELKFSPAMSGHLSSSSAKSAILVAFAMWILTYREDTLRCRLIFYLVMSVIGFAIGWFAATLS